MGWLARKHGLQTNALTAVELVTADGELRRIDHDNEADLFWAVRGGGGNYGVVTALEFELFPAPELYAGSLFFPFERASRGHARLARLRGGRAARRDHHGRPAHAVPADRGGPGDGPREVVRDPPGRVPRQRGGRRRAAASAHGPRSGDEHVRHGRAEHARLPRHGPRPADAVRGLLAARVRREQRRDRRAHRRLGPRLRLAARQRGAALPRRRPGAQDPRARRAGDARRRLPAVRRRRRVHAGRVRRGASARPRPSRRPWRPGTPARATSTSRRARSTRRCSSTPTAGGSCAPCGPTGTRRACSSPTTRSRSRSRAQELPAAACTTGS